MTSGRHVFCLVAMTACTVACSGLTEPAPSASITPKKPAPAAQQAATAAPAPTPPVPPAPAPPAEQGEMATAAHVLVAYQGALRADPSISRSKQDAQKRAGEVLARARKGEDFGKLADEMSDDPSAKRNHGSLGRFSKTQMVPAFSDATFALKAGELSNVIETPFGFHVIKRTE